MEKRRQRLKLPSDGCGTRKNGAQCKVMMSRTELEKNIQKRMKNICFVLDDCFSAWTLETTTVAKFFVGISELINKGQNIKIIITMDSFLLKRNRTMLQHYDIFADAHIVNVSETSLSTEYEKRCILRNHVKDNQARMSHYYVDVDKDNTTGKDKRPPANMDQMDISKHTIDVGFPSMCAMFANIPEFRKQGADFFKFCDFRIGHVLQKCRKGSLSDKRDMCCISYAMLNNRVLDLNNIKLELFGKMWKRFWHERGQS